MIRWVGCLSVVHGPPRTTPHTPHHTTPPMQHTQSDHMTLLPPPPTAEAALVECPLGECLRLPPLLPAAPAAAAQAKAQLPPADLWCVDSSLGTFLASTPDHPLPGKLEHLFLMFG